MGVGFIQRKITTEETPFCVSDADLLSVATGSPDPVSGFPSAVAFEDTGTGAQFHAIPAPAGLVIGTTYRHEAAVLKANHTVLFQQNIPLQHDLTVDLSTGITPLDTSTFGSDISVEDMGAYWLISWNRVEAGTGALAFWPAWGNPGSVVVGGPQRGPLNDALTGQSTVLFYRVFDPAQPVPADVSIAEQYSTLTFDNAGETFSPGLHLLDTAGGELPFELDYDPGAVWKLRDTGNAGVANTIIGTTGDQFRVGGVTAAGPFTIATAQIGVDIIADPSTANLYYVYPLGQIIIDQPTPEQLTATLPFTL